MNNPTPEEINNLLQNKLDIETGSSYLNRTSKMSNESFKWLAGEVASSDDEIESIQYDMGILKEKLAAVKSHRETCSGLINDFLHTRHDISVKESDTALPPPYSYGGYKAYMSLPAKKTVTITTATDPKSFSLEYSPLIRTKYEWNKLELARILGNEDSIFYERASEVARYERIPKLKIQNLSRAGYRF